jgi:imidazole glycerol-phosphate synthase subunit HisH
MRAIALIDYGAGNLTSVRKGFDAAGAHVFTPTAPNELDDASGVVVPGVGHFGATAALSGEWRAAILGAIERGTPMLGICLGLQWLFESSTEAPDLAGLGAMPGRCERLPPIVKVPHVGWNSLEVLRPSAILNGVADGTQVYFTHAYAAPLAGETVAATTHGKRFTAVVERDSLFGVQFHPEKSGDAGIRVLANFVAITAAHA